MKPEPKRWVIVGASRGIGAAVAQHFVSKGDWVISVCRSAPVAGEWVQADVSIPSGIETIAKAVGDAPVDGLLYMGGVWENNAFTEQYDFMKSSDAETRYVISVNAIAPIEITRKLVNNLSQAQNPRAIFIGSLSGLEQGASIEVANTASKFALRGAIQSLRLALRDRHIGFSVINPGNVATAEVLTDIQEGRFPPQEAIPLEDLISCIDWILSLSPHVDVSEINLEQRTR
jgi:NAD(P)-dependent dehydrogenase (short-subunit alcohol dehydrogenase family)